MRRIPLRFCVLAVCLLALNAVGLLLIRQELLSRSDSAAPQLRSTQAAPLSAGTAEATLAAAQSMKTVDAGATAAKPAAVPVKLVSALPKENVDRAERLSLVFDQEVGTPEELNRRLDAKQEPFLITPPPQGHWNWVSATQLDFVLDRPLPAGRRFKVVPASDISSQFGRIVQVAGEIEFQTRPLGLDDCRLIAADRHDVTFELRFNQKVDPQTLLKHLRIGDAPASETADGSAKVPVVKCLTEGAQESVVLRCPRPEDSTLKIRLEEQLTGLDGERPLGKVERRVLALQPVFGYLRSEVREENIDGDFQVRVLFNAGLQEQSIDGIKVAPEVTGLRVSLGTHWDIDGRVLDLRGRFQPGQRYEVRIPKTLLSADGKPLGEDDTITVEIPGPYRRARLEFAQESGLLSPHGNMLLDLRTVNVDRVTFRTERVLPDNLVPHLHNEWESWTRRSLPEKTFTLESPKNETITHAVSLRELMDVKAGLFRIVADASDHDWVQSETLIAITDLALSVRQSREELLVWVTSLRQGRPVEGVTVRSMSFNNQKLTSGTTDRDGLVRLKIDPEHPDGRPWVIIADHEQELAWLRTEDRHWVLDDIDQSGRPHPESLDLMLYTERGTYRPGDTVHLTGILRDRGGQVPTAFPVVVHVLRPDGSEVATRTVTNVEGAPGLFHCDWTSPDDAWTGGWQFRVTLPGSTESLGSATVFIEEFLPVRLNVEAELDRPLITGDELPKAKVQSRYLFGTVAADLPVQITARYSAERFRSKSASAFTFGPRQVTGTVDGEDQAARLDGSGQTEVALSAVRFPQKGRWRASIGATVTEEGGRSVSARASGLIDQLGRHIGLRLADAEFVTAGNPASIEWTLRTADDQPAPFAPLKLELFRIHWDNTLRRVNGSAVWESIERRTPVAQQAIEAAPESSSGRATIICPDSGWFRLVVTEPVSGSLTELDFFAAGPGADRSTLALNRPERLELQLDRTKVRPGETVQAAINSPFPGTLLLCLEADHVLWTQVVAMSGNSMTIPVTLPEAVRGGAFLSATVLRAVDPQHTDWLPHRAYGAARIMTTHVDQKLPLTIDAPTRAAPEEPVAIRVQSQPGALIHLWAVDEGILLTSNWQTPDAHAHFYGPRSNGVTTSDVFAELLPDHRRAVGIRRIGGDDGGTAAELTRDPVPSKKREAVVLWSMFRKAGDDGKLTEELTLPHFTGELRWMAVAVDADRYGSAEKPMTVTAPVLAEAAWPRFASPGDRFKVPVRVFNTTEGLRSLSVAASVTGPLQITVPDAPVEIPSGASRIVWLNVTATGVGPVEGSIRVTAQAVTSTGPVDPSSKGADALMVQSPFALPVRPATARDTDRRFLTLSAGQSLPLPVPDQFLPGTVRTRVTVSADAGIELQPALEELLQYPYGCLEQTSSRLRGLLAAGQWLQPAAAGNGVAQASDAQRQIAREMTLAGIARVWSMQCRSGGLSYWPGGREPDVWASTWAAETLLLARDAQLEVDPRLLDGLRDFLLETLRRSDADQLDASTRAAICHVLARMGQPETGWMSLLSERLADLDLAGRAHLALAWHFAGRRDRAIAALPTDLAALSIPTDWHDWHSSPVAQKARLLSALLAIDASHSWIPRLTADLNAARTKQAWMSTLENALALEALLARASNGQQAEPFRGTVRMGDQTIPLMPGQTQQIELPRSMTAVEVRAEGAGQVFVSIDSTGLTLEAPKENDSGLEVRRRWLTRNGQPVDPQRLRTGDLIFVETSLRATGKVAHENIAIVDALPAGVEVENPRLETSSNAGETSAADHVLFQDDRVVLFATAWPGKNPAGTFRYALRVVTEGRFALPPVEASSMYDASLSSRHGAGAIEVLPVNSAPATGPLADQPRADERK